MATTYDYPSYRDPAVVRPQAGTHTRAVTITTPATNVVNDVLRIFKLPKGAKLIPGWWFESADIDNSTGSRTSVIVVDGNTTKTIISSVDTSAAVVATDQTASVGLQSGWVNYKITGNSAYVAIKVATAATGTYAAGAQTVVCRYLLDTEPGE